jgi:hypothetical protein
MSVSDLGLGTCTKQSEDNRQRSYELASLRPVPGSYRDQTRSAAILSIVLGLRFADIPDIKAEDIKINVVTDEL